MGHELDRIERGAVEGMVRALNHRQCRRHASRL
jgi:hypothetical protein